MRTGNQDRQFLPKTNASSSLRSCSGVRGYRAKSKAASPFKPMRQWARGEARQLFTAIYGLWQSASGARVAIPVGGPLKSALDETPKRSTLILTSSDNKPWTEDGFRSSWRKACATAGIVGLTFHDLGGTAVTRLALAGCTEAEIAAITGHSLRDVAAILDVHYLHRDPALAESAIRKLERRTRE